MKNHHRLMASAALAGFAVLLSACDKNSTAPNGSTRTESITATASVPANPTAPLTIATNNPQSQVAFTIDPATQKLFAAAAGGAGTLTMTDLAPKDYSQAPAGFRSVLSPGDSVVGLYTISVAKGSALIAPQNRALDITAPDGQVPWAFSSSTLTKCSSYNWWFTVAFDLSANGGPTFGAWAFLGTFSPQSNSFPTQFAFLLPGYVSPLFAIGFLVTCASTGLIG